MPGKLMTNTHFSAFPFLTTKRLTLRLLTLDDKEDIFALRSDNEINKYLDRKPAKTIDDAVAFINMINENINNSNCLYWVITITNSRTFVGTIGIFNFSTDENSCEIGYELLTQYQNQGIMKEAAEEVLSYAFKKLGFQKIIAGTHVKNQPSINLLRKLSFTQTDKPDNEDPDYIIFTQTNSDRLPKH